MGFYKKKCVACARLGLARYQYRYYSGSCVALLADLIWISSKTGSIIILV